MIKIKKCFKTEINMTISKRYKQFFNRNVKIKDRWAASKKKAFNFKRQLFRNINPKTITSLFGYFFNLEFFCKKRRAEESQLGSARLGSARLGSSARPF